MTWYFVPCISAPVTEASSSPCDSPESPPEPWLTLSGTPSQRPLSWPGWTRRTWIALLSGLTSPHSTLQRGVAEWISSLPGSPANPSRPQDSSVELTMTGGSGLPSDGSSVAWDRDSSSWRTSPDLFGPGFLTSSPTLPTSGSMRSGVCTPRPRLAHPTDETESGSWPTPRAVNPPRSSAQGTAGPTLHEVACGRDNRRTWPTPKASEGFRGTDPPRPNHTGGASLMATAKNWPTPTAHDAKGQGHDNTNLHNAAMHGPRAETTTPGGATTSPPADLNPRFVEALMGVPAGLADALHLGGNGLVPVVAARALVELADRLGVDLWKGMT